MVFKYIASALILLNLASLGGWQYYAPSSAYEQTAYEYSRTARYYDRKDESEKAYAYFRYVADVYPESAQAEDASYRAGIRAVRDLGDFTAAKKDFTFFVAHFPDADPKMIESAKEYLQLISESKDLPANVRNTVLWEFIQAQVETNKGLYGKAYARYDTISERYPGSTLGIRSKKFRDEIFEMLSEEGWEF